MAKKTSSKLTIGGVPRAHLMPPEVEQRRAVRATGRAIIRLIVLVILVVAGAYGATLVLATSTQATLTAAQNETQQLLLQQGDYAEAKQTNDQITRITEALKVGTSSEVNWSDLYSVVTGSLPDGARVTESIFTGRAPFEGSFVAPSPLSSSRVAVIAVSVSLASPDDATDFLQSLKAEDVIADATLVEINGASGEYLANFRIDFNSTALSQRFAGEAVTQ